MKSLSLVKKAISVAAATVALGAFSLPALAANYPDFTINENSVPGTDPLGNPALVADRLNGLYTEIFIPVFDTATTGTFTSSALFNISAYYQNDVLVPGALGCGFAACYNLYATFNAAGTFSVDTKGNADPTDDTISFIGTSADVTLYLDPDQVLGGDIPLASSTTLLAGEGSIDLGLANGNFEIVFGDLALTDPAGLDFFIAPRPFHIVVDVNGNFTENPLTGGRVSGSANAFFEATEVPEPGSLALAGLALLGLAAARRRKV